jgi:hypothetical protein
MLSSVPFSDEQLLNVARDLCSEPLSTPMWILIGHIMPPDHAENTYAPDPRLMLQQSKAAS